MRLKVLNILKTLNHWLTPPLRPGGAPPAPSISWGMALALYGAWGGAGSSWWPLPGSTSAAATAPAAPSAPASENAHRTSVHPKTLRELNMGVEASHHRSRVPGLAASALLRWLRAARARDDLPAVAVQRAPHKTHLPLKLLERHHMPCMQRC